ncbi:MAG: 50S ribosomal protein L17 [Chloroflexi bacterium]|nr:50S ribosomal protein L17 [Chloroflexota bacterium]
MAGKKLSRSSGARRALFKSLLTELFKNERIETTEAKAKAVRGQAEKLITIARRGDLAARRRVYAELASTEVAKKLVEEIAPEHKARKGGYTRMYKLGPRKGDAAEMVLLELVEDGEAGA